MTTPKTSLIGGLAALLVLATVVPVALGQSPGNSTGKGKADPGPHAMNETERQERHAELQAAREAALASFHENRSKAFDAYHAALNATRASFQENKTRVIEACRAEHPEGIADKDNLTRQNDANETRHNETNDTSPRNETRGTDNDGRSAFGHCVRDGLKPLIEKARAQIRDAHEELRAALEAARDHAKASFASHRHEINAKHGQADA